MVAWTLDALQRVAGLAATLVVLAPDDSQFESQVPDFAGPKAWVARCGGATRAASVSNGLTHLLHHGASTEDWVVVHDAARCLIRPEWVERLIADCSTDAVGGLLALPLPDTLKEGTGGRAQRTIDRRDKWAAQTPQMFRLGALQRALAAAGPQVTDEASAIETAGQAPKLVRGDVENLKITWPEDFALAQRLLATRHLGPAQRDEIKAFVPARDFEQSKRFYLDLGFGLAWADDGLACLRHASGAFLLQDSSVATHAQNMAMHMLVADVDAMWQRIERDRLAERYGVKATPPCDRARGLRDFELFDPSGVRWRIGQRIETQP